MLGDLLVEVIGLLDVKRFVDVIGVEGQAQLLHLEVDVRLRRDVDLLALCADELTPRDVVAKRLEDGDHIVVQHVEHGVAVVLIELLLDGLMYRPERLCARF